MPGLGLCLDQAGQVCRAVVALLKGGEQGKRLGGVETVDGRAGLIEEVGIGVAHGWKTAADGLSRL